MGLAQQHHHEALAGGGDEDGPEEAGESDQPQQPHDLDLAGQPALVLAGERQNDQDHLHTCHAHPFSSRHNTASRQGCSLQRGLTPC